MLHDWGVNCVAYHGGMNDALRESTQNKFINKEVDVAVATNAFGMGIDRSDVRFVVHFEIPGSVEAYYQEAGRAGRDGEAAMCELFFNYADTRTQEFFIEGVNPSYKDICAIYQYLLNQANRDFEVTQTPRYIDFSDFNRPCSSRGKASERFREVKLHDRNGEFTAMSPTVDYGILW